MVKFDVSALEGFWQRMEDMRNKLKDFGSVDMPTEMQLWQTEDMNRQYPETMTPTATSCYTLIYPTSRLRLGMSSSASGEVFPVSKRATPMRMGGRLTPSASRRQILRPELKDRLEDRLQRLKQEKLKWA